MKPLRIGIIPLTDAAPIVAAHERGFFAKHGLEVEVSREPSWATVRDKLAAGALDAAHLLAPMALAASLGIGPYAEPIATGLSLGLGGDAICVSRALRARIQAPAGDAAGAARVLAALVAERRAAGAPALRLATVFPFSMHEYLLRDWLATAGIAPDRDVEIRVVPPPRMVEALAAGTIDGFCVGEPWSSVAVRRGTGAVVATAHDLWPHAPEKVLGVRLAWAERNAETHRALLRALIEAARWCDTPEHRAALLPALSDWTGAERAAIEPALLGRFVDAPGAAPRAIPDFHCFARADASFPWRSHAAWILVQMLRWGHVEKPIDVRDVAASVYRGDWYREAAADLGIAAPAYDEKPEGPPGAAAHFTGAAAVAYLAACEVHAQRVSNGELRSAQRRPA